MSIKTNQKSKNISGFLWNCKNKQRFLFFLFLRSSCSKPFPAQFYIQLIFKVPLCITLTISDQKTVSGSLFLTEKNFFPIFKKKKKITFFKQLFSADTKIFFCTPIIAGFHSSKFLLCATETVLLSDIFSSLKLLGWK